MNFIHWAVPLAICCPASVGTVPANASLEKAAAAIARVDAVVFPRGAIATHFAGNV